MKVLFLIYVHDVPAPVTLHTVHSIEGQHYKFKYYLWSYAVSARLAVALVAHNECSGTAHTYTWDIIHYKH